MAKLPDKCEARMTNEELSQSKLSGRAAACLVAAIAIVFGAACSSDPPVVTVGEPIKVAPLADFCTAGQRAITNARVPITNVVHTDYNAFVQSKPEVKPLTTQQFVTYRGVGTAQPQTISCKFKSADHIKAEYGSQAAGAPASCAYLNRRTLDAVMNSLTKRERKKLKYNGGTNVLVEEDLMVSMGPQWLEPYQMLSTDLSNTLKIRAKGMRNDWTDPRLANAPARLKGTHYCHLIAPDYLKSLLLGEAKPNDESVR
jgi:hypothetical protein